MYIGSVREKMFNRTCSSTRAKILSGKDMFWIVEETSAGFDLVGKDYYQMIKLLNKGWLHEKQYWVFDNWYDARYKLEQLELEAEANI